MDVHSGEERSISASDRFDAFKDTDASATTDLLYPLSFMVLIAFQPGQRLNPSPDSPWGAGAG